MIVADATMPELNADVCALPAATVGISPGQRNKPRKVHGKHGPTVTLVAAVDTPVAAAYGAWIETSIYATPTWVWSVTLS